MHVRVYDFLQAQLYMIENLLEEIDDLKDNEEEMIKDETIEEVCLDLTPKKYHNVCDKCGFITNASKRYETCKQILKHKENCTESKPNKSELKKNCTKCKYVSSDMSNLKRHMRDEHDITNNSISPPRKKPKKSKSGMSEESMDIDSRGGVIDLSESFEDMEIDDNNVELKKLSEAMDRKIIEKEKSIEEKENRLMDKRKETERKREAEEEPKRLNNKKRKQSLKDSRKSYNKKNKKAESFDKKVNNSERVPNIKEIPNNCKELVDDNDVMYVVPGNGACAPNSAAALLFGDEVFGPKLRGRMNKHMAKYFYTRYQNITQCSPGHPFIRKLAGGEVFFDNPEKLIDFLTKSQDAELMWCDSEDLAIISDLYQIKIKVITSKGENDKNPTVNWIHPDKTMKEFAELKKVDLGEMVLFHENDCHFNLIISKDSDLATMGSLSHRFKIGPKEQMNEEEKDITNDKMDEDKDKVDVKELEKELKKVKENQRKAQNYYIQCEKELRNKTEEVEILKIEIKDLKELLILKDKIIEKDEVKEIEKCKKCDFKTNNSALLRKHQENVHESQNFKKMEQFTKCDVRAENKESLKKHLDQAHESPSKFKDTNSTEEIIKCSRCDFLTNSKEWMGKHVRLVHTSENNDLEFNCNQCDFQGTNKEQLDKHIYFKHTIEGQLQKIRCNTCGENFPAMTNLLSHRKNKHIETVAVCRKFSEGRCQFSPEKCWWKHERADEHKNNSASCYVCNENFETKSTMMIHRKNNHKELVSKCNNFSNNKCKFADNACWFLHEEIYMEIDENDKNEKRKRDENKQTESVFQSVFRNIKPPIISEKKI